MNKFGVPCFHKFAMNTCRFTYFVMINGCIEVVFCLSKKYQKLLILRDIVPHYSGSLDNYVLFFYFKQNCIHGEKLSPGR